MTQFLGEIDKLPDTTANEPPPIPQQTAQSDKIPNELNEPVTDNSRKRGVISDQIEPKTNNTTFEIEFYEKDQRTQELIERAIAANDFLNNLMDVDRLNLVVKAMKPMEFESNSIIIKEGEDGSHFFVSADGEFEVVKGAEVKTTFKGGVVFGELGNLFIIFFHSVLSNVFHTILSLSFFSSVCSNSFSRLLQVFYTRRNDLHQFEQQQKQKYGHSNDVHFKKLL